MIYNLTFALILITVPFASLAVESSLKTIEVRPYFAGKDEICVESDKKSPKITSVQLKLVKVVQEIDVHSNNDREAYCTFIGNRTKNKKQATERYSVSGSRCSEWLNNPKEIINVEIVKDHICSLQ